MKTWVTDPKNQATTMTYGYGGQLQSRSGVGLSVSYTRNTLGQVTQAVSNAVTYDYTYDAAHRVATITDSRGPQTLRYTYTPGGRLRNRTQTHQGAEVSRTDYVYDAVGRLSALWAGHGEVITFVYDAGGRLTEQWLPNGVSARYAYNADNTLERITHQGVAGGIQLSEHRYTYDTVGNRATYVDEDFSCNTVTTATYTYDELNRLIQVITDEDAGGQVTSTTETYTYDPLGNRETVTTNGTTKAYVYDLANQLTAIHQDNELGPVLTSLSYDANGNLETKTTTEGTLTLTYDAWDRMIQAQKPWTLPETYAYDDEGRRITKTVGASTTGYLYDGLDIVAEYTTTNWAAPDAPYTHGGGIDAPLIRASQNGSVRTYYHQDGLGSVVAATDELGQAIGTARYDAWGTVARQTGGIPQYGYTGREPDNTGLVYYRARYYDPDTGRFTQPDPIGLSGGTNLYAYAGGDPVNYTDPMGTTPAPQVTRILGSQVNNYFSPTPVTSNNNLSFTPSSAAQSRPLVDISSPKVATAGIDPLPLLKYANDVKGRNDQIFNTEGPGAFSGGIGGTIVGAKRGASLCKGPCGIVTGIVGGIFGGAAGAAGLGQFDSPCDGSLNCGETFPKVPSFISPIKSPPLLPSFDPFKNFPPSPIQEPSHQFFGPQPVGFP